MSLDDELEIMEETGQTEAEQIDEETEIQDVEDDIDEILGPDAMESDQEVAYDSFITNNEEDYDGYDPFEVEKQYAEDEVSNALHSEGYHVIDTEDLKEEEAEEAEIIEIEIDEDMIDAYLFDEDDKEIGFVFTDEDGNEQYCYYVEDEPGEGGEIVYKNGEEPLFTYEQVEGAKDDLNAIYRDGAEIVSELKDTVNDITEGLSFLKKKR